MIIERFKSLNIKNLRGVRMAIKCYSKGAAGEVTGSKHFFEVDDRTYMVDCGAFQGKRKESDEKNRNFDVNDRSRKPA